jgi:phosphoadenosine phosphosulfate reductase
MVRKLDSLIGDSLYMLRAFRGGNPAVSFSGGKDSLVALDLSVRAGISRAVFADTTIEFEDTVKYVDSVRHFYGIDLEIVHPPKSFFELIEVFGFPSRRSRWCCEALKFGPLGKYALSNHVTSFVTGLRRRESNKRRRYEFLGRNPVFPIPQVNPIVNWTDEDVWEYVNEFALHINPLYRHGFKRIGCWPCPFKSDNDWKVTTELFPERIQYLKIRFQAICRKFGVSVRNIDDFVETMAWNAYSFTQTSRISGKMQLIDRNARISLPDKEDVRKVLKLLPLVAGNYDNGLTGLIIRNVKCKKKLKIAIEKAINCVGCGACLILCKKNALNIEHESLNVNFDICNHCGECLKTSRLRGACLRRNYAPLRFEIEGIPEKIETSYSANQPMKLCSDTELMGRIRSKTSMNAILSKIPALGKTTQVGDCVIVQNAIFTASFRQSMGFIDVKFRASKENFSTTIRVIRSALRKTRLQYPRMSDPNMKLPRHQHTVSILKE